MLLFVVLVFVAKRNYLEEIRFMSSLKRISAIVLCDRQINLVTPSPFVRLIASEPSMDGVSRGEFLAPSLPSKHEKDV